MSAFHLQVEGADPSERINQRRAAAICAGIGLALICALFMVAEGDAAWSDPEQHSPAKLPGTVKVDVARLNSSENQRHRTSSAAGTLQRPPDDSVRSDPRADVETPFQISQLTPSRRFPNSEVIHSPGSMNFEVAKFVAAHQGFLAEYRELIAGEWMTGTEVVEWTALNHSINPRLLLAIIEFRSGWLLDPERPQGEAFDFPLRSGSPLHRGLYLQLSWAANTLSRAYYHARLQGGPETNAGTAALDHLMAEMCGYSECDTHLLTVYRDLFGDPWQYDFGLDLDKLTQPPLALPFNRSGQWVLSGGPHAAWGTEYPWAALDFAPAAGASDDVLAVADGLVVRLERGILVLDLDADGYEQTGWSVFYLHVEAGDGIEEGMSVQRGQVIGKASSTGGVAEGDHIHIARKYNGEWIAAAGRVPFELSGWQVRSGASPYEGELYKIGGECVVEVPLGSALRPGALIECDSEFLTQ